MNVSHHKGLLCSISWDNRTVSSGICVTIISGTISEMVKRMDNVDHSGINDFNCSEGASLSSVVSGVVINVIFRSCRLLIHRVVVLVIEVVYNFVCNLQIYCICYLDFDAYFNGCIGELGCISTATLVYLC